MRVKICPYFARGSTIYPDTNLAVPEPESPELSEVAVACSEDNVSAVPASAHPTVQMPDEN